MLRLMKNRALYFVAATVALFSQLCAAQDKGYWRSASTTANAITGDIAISETKVSINYTNFTLAEVRILAPAEVAAAFDADISSGDKGVLYRLTVPAAKRFLKHNTLCGTEDTQWMATYVSGRMLSVDFFSGSNPPVFTFDAVSNSTNLCGTFSYVR
jgi:hypothetical protein